MDIFNFKSNPKSRNDDVLDNLIKIRKGDLFLREAFIDENKNLIMKVVSDILGKSTITKNSKEFEIGLSAFDHAIDNFDLNSKESFIKYSEQIVKDWIINYLRSNPGNYSSSNILNSEKDYLHYSLEDTEGISLIKLKLWEFGITLEDLVPTVPDNDGEILSALKIAQALSDNQKLFDKLTSKKDIPYEDLDDKIKSQKKYIEKYKRYIITLTLILKSDLKILNSYLKNIDSGKGFSEKLGIVLELYKKEALIFTFQGKIIVIKIKNTNDMITGKQLKLEGYNVKSNGKRDTKKYFLISAAALIILASTFAFAYRYLSNNGTENTVSEVLTSSTNNKPDTVFTKEPVNTDNKQVIDVLPTEESKTEKPVNTNTPKPSPELTSKPTRKAVEHEPTPKHVAVSSIESSKPVYTPSSSITTGVPGIPDISSDLYTVKVGQKYTVFMNMYQGNNAKSVILYENDEVFSVKQINANTPKSQSASVTITAKYEGMYKYKWELINDFGATSSSSIWINVVNG